MGFHMNHLFARQRLHRRIIKECKPVESARQQLRWVLRRVSPARAARIITIMDSMPKDRAMRARTAMTLISIAIGANTELRYRIIADHFEYAQNLTCRNNPADTIELICSAIGYSHELRPEQERALIRLEGSSYNKGDEKSDNGSYSQAFRYVALQRPADIERIITVAKRNPDMKRTAEIEAVLNGGTIAPLAAGAL